MQKIAFIALLITGSVCLGASLNSMNKSQFEKVFVNRTFTSIPTDNLNGLTINNTFSMYLDNKGNIWGEMANKPENEPQVDKGIYTITKFFIIL